MADYRQNPFVENCEDEKSATIAEAAYRRGYCQGFFAVLEFLEANKDNNASRGRDVLYDHFHDELMEWRYSRHLGTCACPPEPAEKPDHRIFRRRWR